MKETEMKEVDKMLALLATLEKINQVDPEQLERALDTPVREVKLLYHEKKALERKFKNRKPGRPKVHWKIKRAKLLARKKRYYLNTVKPRRQKAYVEYLERGDWFEICLTSWKRRKLKVQLTKDEWNQYVRVPEGRIPIVMRIDTKGPISLENIEVLDNESRKSYFNGLDVKLERLMTIEAASAAEMRSSEDTELRSECATTSL